MKLKHDDPAYIQAMRLFLLGQWREAEKEFIELEKIYTESAFVSLTLGNICYSLGKLEESVEHYKRSLKKRPRFGNAYYKLGVSYYRMGRLRKSLEAFNQVVACGGQGHAMAYYFVGLINHFLGNIAAAEEAFGQLRDASPISKIANFYLSQLKLEQRKYDEAVTLLAELREANPDFAEVHYLMGLSYFGLHKNQQAIASYKKALELNPEDQRVKSNLSLLTETQWP